MELTNTGSSLSWIELTGSNINYTPPANSSVIEYELTFYVYSVGTQNSGIGLQFYIDDVPQTITSYDSGSVNWIVKGQAVVLSAIKIRILDPSTMNPAVLGNNNTVYLSVDFPIPKKK